MKRRLLALAAAGVLVASAAYAANITLTPIVPPTETGENSLGSQQVTDMARFKLGMGTVAITVSGSAGAGTCNFAACIITLSAATAGASGATPTVITLTDSKVQAADIVLCTVDQTGATAGAVLVCNSHEAAGSATLTLYDASATALLSSTVVLNIVTVTNGNPN